MQDRREKIINEPLTGLLIHMSVPTIIGMLVMVVYNLTDTYFIGKLENKSMTAAIGIAFSFVSFIQALGFWFGYGSGNVMSRKLGAKEEEEAAVISSTGIVMAIFTGIVLSAVLLLFVEPLAAFLGGSASEALLKYSTEYLRVILYSVPFSLYGVTVYNQLRLCGNAKDGILGLMSGMFCNMVLDPVFIFVFRMGFIGAGWATFAGQLIGSVVLTVLSGRNGNIPVRLDKVNFGGGRLYHILAGGAPNFSRQGITGVAAILVNIVAADYGEDAIAALTVAGRVAAVAYMIVIGWSQGFQPICAMNYGAGKYERVRKALWISATAGTVFLIVASVLMAVFAEPLIAAIMKNEDVVRPGALILRLQCISMPVMGIYALCSMFTQNIGHYFKALIISISRQGLFYIPLLFLVPAVFRVLGADPMTGLFAVQPVADIAAFLFGAAILQKELGNMPKDLPAV